MKKAYMFPGQGGQSVGMGRELYNSSAEARAVFDEVDGYLGEKLSDVIFNGPEEALNLPQNVQPAVFAVSAAMFAAAKAGGRLNEDSDFVLGHSLGEYAALWAAGCAGLGDLAALLRRRGELMQSAAGSGGAMGVIIGVDPPSLCSGAASDAEVCEVANDNGAGQWVISGRKGAVERALEGAKAAGAKLVRLLNVPVPAHSSLMSPIVDEFRAEISRIKWTAPRIPFVSNKTAGVVSDIEEIKESLVYQLTHGVRWRECVQYLGAEGVGEFVEIGPGNVLTGLCRRILPESNCQKLEV
jgi:[acyl-carrier-protein] S-malonyltransferase